jgi:hypothetical protein
LATTALMARDEFFIARPLEKVARVFTAGRK